MRTKQEKKVWEEGTMISRVIKAAVIAGLLAVIVASVPDVKRYLELRDM